MTDSQAVRTALGEAAARRRVRSTTLVALTSSSARPASFRPTIAINGQETRVVVEQTSVVDPQRLGASAGRLDARELRGVDGALALILGL